MGQGQRTRAAIQSHYSEDRAADHSRGDRAVPRQRPRERGRADSREEAGRAVRSRGSRGDRETPRRTANGRGIGPKRRERIAHAWQEAKQVREIMLFLHSHGVSTSRAVRIFKTYGEQAIEKVRENPYALAKDIEGSASRPPTRAWFWSWVLGRVIGYEDFANGSEIVARLSQVGEFKNAKRICRDARRSRIHRSGPWRPDRTEI